MNDCFPPALSVARNQVRYKSRLLPGRRCKKLATGAPLVNRDSLVANTVNGIRLLSRRARRYTFW